MDVVFARVGWMLEYQATVTNEPPPVGGGKYTRNNVGYERDNFLVRSDGLAYGYFAVGKGDQSIKLFQVTGRSNDRKASEIRNVLVIFLATNPAIAGLPGSTVVGWFRNATLYRDSQTLTSEQDYRVKAAGCDVFVLPVAQRIFAIPRASRGVQGIGQSNIYYTHESNGSDRKFIWLDALLNFIKHYSFAGVDPATAIEIANERKAGFQSDPVIRRLVERRAMAVTRQHFHGLHLEDTSATKPYDFTYETNDGKRYIEVKGSQLSNPTIVLTRNEVTIARNCPESIALCIVHSINVVPGVPPTAIGGIVKIHSPWNPDEHQLEALQYQCTLKP